MKETNVGKVCTILISECKFLDEGIDSRIIQVSP